MKPWDPLSFEDELLTDVVLSGTSSINKSFVLAF